MALNIFLCRELMRNAEIAPKKPHRPLKAAQFRMNPEDDTLDRASCMTR